MGVTVAGASATLHRAGAVLHAAAPADDGPTEVTWSSPPDGPWLVVPGIRRAGVLVVGTESTEAAPASFLPERNPAARVAYAAPPRPLAQGPVVPVASGRRRGIRLRPHSHSSPSSW